MKKALKIGGGIIGALLLLLLGYVIYVFAAYDRIEDNQELSVLAYRNFPQYHFVEYRIRSLYR